MRYATDFKSAHRETSIASRAEARARIHDALCGRRVGAAFTLRWRHARLVHFEDTSETGNTGAGQRLPTRGARLSRPQADGLGVIRILKTLATFYEYSGKPAEAEQ